MEEQQVNKRVKSLFEELSSFVNETDTFKSVNSRSEHLFSSVVNVFDAINAVVGEENRDDLLKFFMLAVKHKDYQKFKKRLDKYFKKQEK